MERPLNRDYSTLSEFWVEMSLKLQKNGHKPGWRDDSLDKLWYGYICEVGELEADYEDLVRLRSVIRQEGTTPELVEEFREKLEDFRGETYDVANFAFFLWDLAGLLLEDAEAMRMHLTGAEDINE